MKNIIFSIVILVMIVSCSPQSGASRTSSAAAAYGNAEGFKAHTRKNNKAKKKAARKKKPARREPYRMLPL